MRANYLLPATIETYRERFLVLLERYVSRLSVRGMRVTGLAPCHDDRSPSFSADLHKLVWYCHACGKGGGVRDFALLVGEGWVPDDKPLSRHDRARFAALARRREAEQRSHAILQKQCEERLDETFREWREYNRDAANAVKLLALFHRRPDLAVEFPDLVMQAERDYSAVIHRRVWIEAWLDREVTA